MVYDTVRPGPFARDLGGDAGLRLGRAHCRASVVPCRNPGELTTEEGFRLLAEVRSFGEPLMIFTGGDPLKRPDIFELLSESVRLGLRITITPSATPLLTRDAIAVIHE